MTSKSETTDRITVRIAPQGRWAEVVEGIRHVCEQCGYGGVIELSIRGEVSVHTTPARDIAIGEVVDKMPPPPIPQISIHPHNRGNPQATPEATPEATTPETTAVEPAPAKRRGRPPKPKTEVRTPKLPRIDIDIDTDTDLDLGSSVADDDAEDDVLTMIERGMR